MSKKYKILLFQPVLRKHILNFGKYLSQFEFVISSPKKTEKALYNKLPNYHQEIKRRKKNLVGELRKIFGIPNIRIKMVDKTIDLIFTYSCLLFSNKPYCVYIENGLSLYDYDFAIAKNPIARFMVKIALLRKNLKKIIFMSQAAYQSFFSTVNYGERASKIIAHKSTVIYPLIERKTALPKKYHRKVKLFFSGLFYMKGGLELVMAFEQLRRKYPNIELTIVTVIRSIKRSDLLKFKDIKGLRILNAQFSEKEMNRFYQDHDIFILPTFRDSFGLVLIEALSFGMPIICTDQFALKEMAIDGYNGYVYSNHPFQDYHPETFQMYGKYHEPIYFYRDLINAQKSGVTAPVKEFLYRSIEKFLIDHDLLEKFSRRSLELYQQKFDSRKLSDKIESVFRAAVKE